MFKVETSGVSQAPSALSLNPQSNFDFELSFCDDGTTDDLFDTFATEAPERSNGGTTSSSSGSLVGSSSSPMESVATGSRHDASHIKIEPEDSDVNMTISSELTSENSPSVSSAVCSSAIDASSTPIVVQPQDSLRTASISVGENGPSDSTTPSPTNSSSGNVSASGTAPKKGNVRQQPPIDKAVGMQVEKRTMWSRMASVFVGAGVPLHIFRNDGIRNWFQENVKHIGGVPSETSLRRYLAQEGEADIQETRNICFGKDVIVIVDETQDIKNRKIANLLVAPAEVPNKFRLLHTEILEKCDAAAIVQFIINGLHAGGMTIANVIAFISDNAKYMISAGKTLLQINPKCIHSTCWAHILHLVSEDVRGSLPLADQLIAKVKACLVKAPNRRLDLLLTLEQHDKTKKLPPTPVITRWTTWLEAGDYHFKNFPVIKEWILNSEPDSLAMKHLQELVQNEGLLKQIEDCCLIYPSMKSAIRTLEGNNICASDVMLTLEVIQGILEQCPSFEAGLSKLQAYLTEKHPSLRFWNEVQFFDPRQQHKFSSSAATSIPASLQQFLKNPIPAIELITYGRISSGFVSPPEFSPINFWRNHTREMPCLSELALKLLSIPPTSAEVERSFSFLNRLVIPSRSSLTPENLAVHLRIQFNNRETKSDLDESDFDSENEDEKE